MTPPGTSWQGGHTAFVFLWGLTSLLPPGPRVNRLLLTHLPPMDAGVGPTLYHCQQRCDDPGLHAHLTALPSVLRVHPQKWPFRVAGHSAARGVRLSQRLPRLTPPPTVRGAPASPHPRQYLLFSAVLRGSILVGEG